MLLMGIELLSERLDPVTHVKQERNRVNSGDNRGEEQAMC